MIRLKLVKTNALPRGVSRYYRGAFVREILGTFDEPKVPPFRDPESQLFIREVDEGHLVEEDWYSYVSPYGRTCLSSLCGGTQYALTVIYHSRKGVYTTYVGYGEDIWQRLKSLDMDILVAFDPAYCDIIYLVPPCLRGCTVESVQVGGRIYQNAVYDGGRQGKNYTDEAGVFHFNGWLDDYKWDWTQHLDEIFQEFERDVKEAVLPSVKPTALTIPPQYKDDYEWTWPRDILCYSDAFVLEGYDSYPQALSLYKHRDGTFTVRENSPYKRPDFYFAMHHVIEWWRNDCEKAFYVFIDTGAFFQMERFRNERLWYFEDDGKTLRVYSGIRGLHRLLEFADNAWKDGRMRAEK